MSLQSDAILRLQKLVNLGTKALQELTNLTKTSKVPKSILEKAQQEYGSRKSKVYTKDVMRNSGCKA